MAKPPVKAPSVAADGIRVVEPVETVSVADLAPAEEAGHQLIRLMAANTRVFPNMSQEILAVPVDRLHRHLRDYRDALAKRTSWHTPAGILASLLAALVASDFNDRWLPAATWRAVFVLSALLCGGWLLGAAYQAFRARSRGDDIETIIERLKPPPEGA